MKNRKPLTEEQKEAQKLRNKKWREDNKEKIKEWRKEYYEKNKETIKKRVKDWVKNNPDKKREQDKLYRQNNPEAVKEGKKRYVINNPEKVKESKIKYRNSNLEQERKRTKEWSEANPNYINEYNKNRKKYDPVYKLSSNIRNMIYYAIIKGSTVNKTKTETILGCSFEELRIYLESKFEGWMSWENHGLYNGELNYGWDVDHIIPISSANDEAELIKLSHYTNLQPLCSKVNRDIKRAKY